MAGDDLESDDEYLVPTRDDDKSDGLVGDGVPAHPSHLDTDENTKRKRKRKGASGEGRPDAEEAAVSKSKKKSKNGISSSISPHRLLIETGRGIAERDREVQATFLWTCLSHSHKMSGGADGDGDGDGESTERETERKFRPEDFYSPRGGEAASNQSFTQFLRGGAVPSLKKLKKWKTKGSPMVIVVCSSARRAVAVLKELAPLNVRCAKLFAKHMDLEEQISMLDENPYGIAVGTPNRLLKLFEPIEGSDESQKGALSLERTALVVIDSHEDHKRFTVCTLRDTAPDLMKFIRLATLPQIQKRDTFKLAFF